MATLSDYLTATRRIVHDANATYWSDTDLIAYINQAIKQRDWDSGQNQAIQSITLTAAQNTYLFNASPFLTTTISVTGIVVVIGNYRYQMSQVSYSELGSIYQPYQGYQNIPVAFAYHGATRIILAPTPQQAYPSEWDTLQASADLVNLTDPDPLPYPWTDPVPYLAAHFAKIQIQQGNEAQAFLDQYYQRLNSLTGGVRGQSTPQPYFRAMGGTVG
jgi:hypothetical protein